MGEGKGGGGEKSVCRGLELGVWWLGGHENVNLDVSEAIYSSLGNTKWGEGGGDCVSGLNLNHIVQQTKCYHK